MPKKNAQNYLEILQAEFDRRAARNPRYSLRSFARTLEISPSRLSQIIRGKQGLSLAWAYRIAERLQFSDDKKQYFCDLVEAKHSRTPMRRKLAQSRLLTYQQRTEKLLQLDGFQVVADWYHGAIRELTLIQGFKSDPAWIAEKLGVSAPVIEAAIERLIRLGLLARDGDGTLRTDEKTVVSTPNEVPSEAIRQYHTQVLSRATEAIQSQSPSERHISSFLIRFDTDRLPEASQALHDFRKSFSMSVDCPEKTDSVYCFAVQFFRVDRREGKSI